MKLISEKMGIDDVSLVRILNFLPYPLLVSEFRNGQQHNIFVNKNFIEEIGYSCEDIPTIDVWFANAYPNAEYRSAVTEDWKRLVVDAKNASNDFVTKQAQIKTKFQGEKWFEVKASLFGPINVVVFVNIDNEVKREQQLELLNENKDRILSILSHDLRSPLVNLQSVLGLISSNSVTESEKVALLSNLTGQVFRMIEFLDTTLHWTRINFSKLSPSNEPVDVEATINNVLALYRWAIHEKKQQVHVEIEAGTQAVGDSEIFSILMRNLISNAIKYTPIGGEITITAKQGQYKFIIEVENSGAAIKAAAIEDILNKKYVSKQGTQGEKGLGLGLRLCLQLLESVNGEMEIETPTSDSSLFRIKISQ